MNLAGCLFQDLLTFTTLYYHTPTCSIEEEMLAKGGAYHIFCIGSTRKTLCNVRAVPNLTLIRGFLLTTWRELPNPIQPFCHCFQSERERERERE